MVEDGPVTLAANHHQPPGASLETHITELTEEGWLAGHQVVVVEESTGADFSIPVEQVEQAEIEIIEDTNILPV